MASEGAAALRRRLQQLEGRAVKLDGGGRPAAPAAVSFGLPELDSGFRAGGLEPGSHQAAGEGAATLGFTLAIVARLMTLQPRARTLVVQEADAVRENGALYAPGLQAIGVDPRRVLLAEPRVGAEALRIADDAARSGAFKAVLLELRRGETLLDLSLTRRLNLAVERTGAFVFLVTPTLEGTSAALTRWEVRPDPSRSLTAAARRLLGRPTFAAALSRNRLGPAPANFILEWDSHERTFRAPAPIPAPVAARPALGNGAAALAEPGLHPAAGGRRQVG